MEVKSVISDSTLNYEVLPLQDLANFDLNFSISGAEIQAAQTLLTAVMTYLCEVMYVIHNISLLS